MELVGLIGHGEIKPKLHTRLTPALSPDGSELTTSQCIRCISEGRAPGTH